MKKIYFVLLLSAFVACGKNEDGNKGKVDSVATNKTATTDTPTPSNATPATTTATTNAPVANLRYAANDELNVLAGSGLVLREKADPNGKKIANVAYGSKVKVLAEDLGKTTYSVDEMAGFKIDGHWVKVETGGKTGYLFDGFLSKWPAPKKLSPLEEYMNKVAKKVKTDKTAPKKEDPRDAEVFDYKKTTYDDGSELVSQNYEGGGSTEIIVAKNKITFAEAYLIMKALSADKSTKCKYNAKTQSVDCNAEGEAAGFEIREKEGKISMRYSIID